MGWLAASYSSKSTNNAGTIQSLEKELWTLRDLKNQPDCIIKTLCTAYPKVPKHKIRHYTLMINDLSCQYKLSWSLIAATIWVESQFDPTLTSPQEAKGLMQLLENTAADQALKMGIKYYADKTVWDDITNLSLGVHYLREAYEKEKDYQKATYYYLAGPQWRKTIIKNSRVRGYIQGYASHVLKEKEKLDMLYLGLSGDMNNRQSFPSN